MKHVRSRGIRTVAASMALALAGFAAAQTPDRPPSIPSFGVATELVYVRFHVEKKGGYVGGLTREQVRVLEDGKPQKIVLLETPDTRERRVPPQVTLALDVSSSVMDAGLLDEALLREAFFAGLGAQTSVGLCAFGGELRCFTPPTRSVRDLMEGFQQAVLFGRETRMQGTRLYASAADIFRQKPATEGEKAQRAVVIFSDGLDNRQGKVGDAIQAALDHDVRVYAVKLSQAFQDTAPSGPFGGRPSRTMYDYKKFDLDQKALGEILRSIATEVRMENVIGYEPEGLATGRKRKVKVELLDKSVGTIKDGERTLVR